jgi:hypothetical protein
MDTAIASAVSYAGDVKTKMESLYRIVRNATSASDRGSVVSTFDDKKESAPPTYTGNERVDKIIGRFVEISSKWSNLIISFILSCLIANELIMYPSIVRFAFFLFTFFMCYSFGPYKGFIIFYYFGKWVYNRFLSDKEIVGNLSLPKIYSILPLIYHKSDEPVSMGDKILNGLKIVSVFYPRYEDAEALKETMEKYKMELKASFPYYETVKSVAEIKGLEVAMNAYLDGIHTESKPRTEEKEDKYIQKVDDTKVNEATVNERMKMAQERNLPLTIKELEDIRMNYKESTQTAAASPLPPTLAPASAPSPASAPASAPAPAPAAPAASASAPAIAPAPTSTVASAPLSPSNITLVQK